jgi:branched-chain amino acid transport system substrate-binding protein
MQHKIRYLARRAGCCTILTPGCLCLLILLVFSAGCSKRDERPHVSRPVLRLGAVIPLTGPSAEFGQDDWNAIRLAVRHLTNRQSTVAIVCSAEDTRSEKKNAMTAFQALISAGPLNLLFVESSGANLALAPEIEKNRILTVSIGAHPDITKQCHFTIRNLPTAEYDAKHVIAYAASTLQAKSIGLFYINTDYGISYVEPFQRLSKDAHMAFPYREEFSPDVADYKTQIEKLKASQVDAVFLVGYGSSMGTLIRQLRELGYTGQILAASGVINDDVQKAAGTAIHGVLYTDVPFSLTDTNTLAKQFAEDYRQMYGRAPTAFASSIYDGVSVALEALIQSDLKPEKALEFLKTKGAFSAVNGELTISEDRNIIYPLAVKKIP